MDGCMTSYPIMMATNPVLLMLFSKLYKAMLLILMMMISFLNQGKKSFSMNLIAVQ
jgi:hypothetical protein